MEPSAKVPRCSPSGAPGGATHISDARPRVTSPGTRPIPGRWRPTKIQIARALTLSSALAVCAWIFAILRDSRNPYGFEWVNHDVAFNLYTGRLVLEGQRLYVDRFEINPPGIFFLSGLIDRVATWVQVSSILLFHALVLVLGLFGLFVVQNVLMGRDAPHGCAAMPCPDGRASPYVLTFASLAFLLVIIGCGLPGEASFTYAFGQREHLFTLVFIPYLLWRMSLGTIRASIAVLLGLLGLFAGMKPHLFLLLLAVEVMVGRAGPVSRRSVWFPLAGGAILPYLVLLLHSPRSFGALFTEVIPRYFDGAYAYFNQPYSAYWASPAHRWMLGFAGATGYLLWPASRKGLLSARASLCVAVLPVLAYGLVVVQHKFWGYHSVVTASLLVVLGSTMGATLLAFLPGWRRHAFFAIVLLAAIAALASAAQSTRRMVSDWKSQVGPGAELMKVVPHLRTRSRTLYYSTSDVHTRLPLVLRQHEVGRWGHDFLYPSIVRDPNPEHRKHALDRYCAEQAQLIRNQRPDAIVFHATGQALTAREQDVDRVLLQDCRIVPAEMYFQVLLPGAERVTLFVLR